MDSTLFEHVPSSWTVLWVGTLKGRQEASQGEVSKLLVAHTWWLRPNLREGRGCRFAWVIFWNVYIAKGKISRSFQWQEFGPALFFFVRPYSCCPFPTWAQRELQEIPIERNLIHSPQSPKRVLQILLQLLSCPSFKNERTSKISTSREGRKISLSEMDLEQVKVFHFAWR